MPFDFLKRKKTPTRCRRADTGRCRADVDRRAQSVPRPCTEPRSRARRPVRRPDRGVAARRADGTSTGDCPTRSTSASRSTITEVQWAPIDGSEPLSRGARAQGDRPVRPDHRPGRGGPAAAADRRTKRAAHRIHKVAYDLALEVPPFRVIGTVYLYPGSEPGAAARPRRRRCSCRSCDARATIGDAAEIGDDDGRDPGQPLLPARRRAGRRRDRRAGRAASRRGARRRRGRRAARRT